MENRPDRASVAYQSTPNSPSFQGPDLASQCKHPRPTYALIPQDRKYVSLSIKEGIRGYDSCIITARLSLPNEHHRAYASDMGLDDFCRTWDAFTKAFVSKSKGTMRVELRNTGCLVVFVWLPGSLSNSITERRLRI